jgi:ABC-type bacteriocin/lantibiotic exporter with double-glycine peptidase domain
MNRKSRQQSQALARIVDRAGEEGGAGVDVARFAQHASHRMEQLVEALEQVSGQSSNTVQHIDQMAQHLDGIFALAALLAMFYFHAVLASVVLLFVILEAALRLGVTPLLRRLSEQRIVAEAQTSTGLMESMRAIEIIKFYCCELARIASWRNHHAEQVNAQVQVSRVLVRVETAYGLLNGIEHVLVIYLAALAVMALWYSGTLVPVSFLKAVLGYYLLKKPQTNTYHPKHIISAH